MLAWNPKKISPFWKQVLGLSFLAWIAVAPHLSVIGTNVVTQTYESAARLLWHGQLPYAPPDGKIDLFKYSPFFAFAYGPFAALPDRLHAVVWALFNCLIFWWGVSRWFLLSRRQSWFLWVALILCAAELNISLRYQQTNAAVIGAVLIALADFEQKRWRKSGVLLAVDTVLKILPGVFLAPLLYPWNKRFFLAATLSGLACLCIPALVLGIDGNIQAHSKWLQILTHDYGTGMLDIKTVCAGFGWPVTGIVLKCVVTLGTLGLLSVSRLYFKKAFPFQLWFCVGAAFLLLYFPRTESPTFVLIAPAYLFLAQEIEKLKAYRRFCMGVFGLMGFSITLRFTDLWPKIFWDQSLHYTTKTFGTFVLWVLAATLLARALVLVIPQATSNRAARTKP